MAYSRRLVHSCNLFRPTVTQDGIGVGKAAYPGSPTTANIPCLLQPKPSRRDLREFGADVQCDAIVLFMAGEDVRPRLGMSDGKNDKLVITDRLGNVTTWVVQASRNPALADVMLTVAVAEAK